MSKNVKSTYEKFVESLSPTERKKFDEERREFIISEMICAAMKKDDVSVRRLAKMADVAPATVQNLRSGFSGSGASALFKVFKSLGYTIVAEKGDERLTLVVPDAEEKSSYEEAISSINYAPRLARGK